MYLHVIIDILNLSVVIRKAPGQLVRLRTTRTTGETASHYRHLECEWSYEEGRALVNSYDSYDSYNW